MRDSQGVLAGAGGTARSWLRRVAVALGVAVACASCATINPPPPPQFFPDLDGTGFPGCVFMGLSDQDCTAAAARQNCTSKTFALTIPTTCKAFECQGTSSPSPQQPYLGTNNNCEDTRINWDAILNWRGLEDAGGPMLKQADAAVVTITEFPLPQAGVMPGPIVSAGQNLVFSSAAVPCKGPACDVYQVDTAGKITPLGATCSDSNFCRHNGLAPTQDGGYCYTTVNDRFPLGPPDNGAPKPDSITCVTPGGTFSHPLHVQTGFVAGIALGGDGRMWYLDTRWNGIGRLDVANPGKVEADYLLFGTKAGWASIAKGPDTAMWFTAPRIGRLGRMSAKGLEYLSLTTTNSGPAGITAGPDGNMWVTQLTANKIARVTPAGVVTEFALPTADAQPLGITAGPDGALWFTEVNANKIGRITVFGEITEYPVPTTNSQPSGIVTGPDGNLWFTEFNGNKIGKVTLSTAALPQVIEFYNTILDNYFITANPAEQAAIDGGSAGPGWRRTGAQFASGGASTVCRFYGSISPGPNSHFYTADPNECASLKQLQATTPATQKRWNFESNDFNTTPAANGACPAGLTPIYRAYNNGFARGVDSNHRIAPGAAAIAEVVARGWSSEGVVMCAP